MSIALNRRCRFSQEIFLTLHKVSVLYDETDFFWGLYWTDGFMTRISRGPDRAEAVAVASLFVEWSLTVSDPRLNPGQLIRGAWFFYNPDDFRKIRERWRDDVDSEPMYAFVEEQLSLFGS